MKSFFAPFKVLMMSLIVALVLFPATLFNESTAEAAYGTYEPIYKEVFSKAIYAYTEDDIDYYVSECGAYRDVNLGSYSDYRTCDVYVAGIKHYRSDSQHSRHYAFVTEYDFYLLNSEWWYGITWRDTMNYANEGIGRVSENANAQKVFNIIYPKMQSLMRESENKERIAEEKRREERRKEQRIAEENRKAEILNNPNNVYEIANNLLKKGLKTNDPAYYFKAIPYYELYLKQRIELKEYTVNREYYTGKDKLIEEADVSIGVGYIEIGICYAGIDDYKKAEECYYKIRSISPPENFYGKWRYYYGVLCEKLKLYDEALYNYNVALKEAPEWAVPEWQNLLSDIKESKHRLEKLGVKPSSKSQYSLSKDNDTNKIIEEVNVKIKAKNYESAKKFLNEALQKEANAELYLQLAKVHMKDKKKDYKLMIDLVSKAIKLDPKNPNYYDYMAYIYDRLSWRAIGSRGTDFEIYFYAKNSCGGPPEKFYKNKANELRSLGSR